MKEKIYQILSESLEVPVDKINDSSTLDDLDADSVLVVEVMYKIEEEFGVEVGDDAVDKIKTVGDLCDYVATLVK